MPLTPSMPTLNDLTAPPRLWVPEGELPLSHWGWGGLWGVLTPRKATGPDNSPRRVLKCCADKLTEGWTDIFNTSVSQTVVLLCLKTVSSVPKYAAGRSMDGCWPVALTLRGLQCWECLVTVDIKEKVDIHVDPDQYACKKNRSVVKRGQGGPPMPLFAEAWGLRPCGPRSLLFVCSGENTDTLHHLLPGMGLARLRTGRLGGRGGVPTAGKITHCNHGGHQYQPVQEQSGAHLGWLCPLSK